MILQIIILVLIGVFVGVTSYKSGKKNAYKKNLTQWTKDCEDSFNHGYQNGYHNGVVSSSKINVVVEKPDPVVKKKAKKKLKK